MKLRMQANSIRLRLKRGEVETLVKSGCLEEKIVFGAESSDVFHFVLESSHGVSATHAILKDSGLLVQVPAEEVERWASGDEVGIAAAQTAGKQARLHILIEKDFACLNGPAEENIDTFPHPLAGAKC